MPRSLITAPSVEPLSKEEAKDHLKVTDSDSDTLIESQIVTSRLYCETVLGRVLITQTWDVYFDVFPAWIEVPMPRLQSVTSIKYTDTDGVQQTLAASKYKVDAISEPGRIQPAFGEVWPSTRGEFNAVVVQFKAGYGDAGSDVPQTVRDAMKLLIGYWFRNRGDVVIGKVSSELAAAVDALLFTERVWSV